MCLEIIVLGIGGGMISPNEEVDDRGECVRWKKLEDATSEDTGDEEPVAASLGRRPVVTTLFPVGEIDAGGETNGGDLTGVDKEDLEMKRDRPPVGEPPESPDSCVQLLCMKSFGRDGTGGAFFST